MTIVAFPLDAVAGAPSYTGEMLRQALSVLAGVAPSGRPLGATSGVRQGTPTTTVTASSTTWTIAAHSGCLDLETSATAGPYFYAVKVAETGAITAANATNPRVDIVYVKVNDPAEGDGSSTPAVVSGYLAGTAAASPVAPATPARSMVLAQINVPTLGGGSPSVTFVAPFMAAPGGVLPGATAAITVNFTTDATFGCVGVWSWPEDHGGYGTGATLGNTTPLQVPTGLGGLYVVSWIGAANVSATALSFVQINGMPYTTRGLIPAGTAGSGAPAGGTARLADGATLGLTMQIVNGGTTKTVTGQLSLYRIGS